MKNTAGTSTGGYRACARGTSDAVLSEQSYDDFIAECASPVAFAIVEVEQIERAAGPFRTISSCGPSTRTSPSPPIIRVGRAASFLAGTRPANTAWSGSSSRRKITGESPAPRWFPRIRLSSAARFHHLSTCSGPDRARETPLRAASSRRSSRSWRSSPVDGVGWSPEALLDLLAQFFQVCLGCDSVTLRLSRDRQGHVQREPGNVFKRGQQGSAGIFQGGGMIAERRAAASIMASVTRRAPEATTAKPTEGKM